MKWTSRISRKNPGTKLTRKETRWLLKIGSICTKDIKNLGVDEKAKLAQGIRTGTVSEQLLKKAFPDAYKGITKLKQEKVRNPMKTYFETHLSHIPNGAKQKEWCELKEAVVDHIDSERVFVRTKNGVKEYPIADLGPVRVIDPRKLKPGRKILIHRDHIVGKL